MSWHNNFYFVIGNSHLRVDSFTGLVSSINCFSEEPQKWQHPRTDSTSKKALKSKTRKSEISGYPNKFLKRFEA